MSQNSTLILYKNILTAARYFPSRKRTGIIKSIKEEFRINKALSDKVKIDQCLAVARRGLLDLQSYMPTQSSDISITLRGATSDESSPPQAGPGSLGGG